MIEEKQKLTHNLFSDEIDSVPIRDGFGSGLLRAGDEDERVVALCADLTESARAEAFAKKYPKRFVQVGVAEQNLAGVASGMAAMGKIPFMTSYAMFSPGRNWEQIRTTICYNDRPVKIVGSHAGISVGPDGGTHQAIEDIAITRVIPRMNVVVPCDAIEAEKATLAIAKTDSPSYLRLARNKSPVITTEDSPFELGKANLLWTSDATEVGIVACGPTVYNSLIAARKLKDEGIGVDVLNMHTIKPLDKEALLNLSRKNKAIVTVEEHQTAGGMGSAVAEFLASNNPVKIEFVGVKDQFGQSGQPEELVEHYGMGVQGIISAVKRLLQRS